jgi:hypothetical protein
MVRMVPNIWGIRAISRMVRANIPAAEGLANPWGHGAGYGCGRFFTTKVMPSCELVLGSSHESALEICPFEQIAPSTRVNTKQCVHTVPCSLGPWVIQEDRGPFKPQRIKLSEETPFQQPKPWIA